MTTIISMIVYSTSNFEVQSLSHLKEDIPIHVSTIFKTPSLYLQSIENQIDSYITDFNNFQDLIIIQLENGTVGHQLSTSLEYIFDKTADSDLIKIENQFNNLINRTGNLSEFNENVKVKVRNLKIDIDKYQNSSMCASQNNNSFCDGLDFNLTDATNSFAQFGTFYRKWARDYL